jgi:aromatic ring hydroxylase
MAGAIIDVKGHMVLLPLGSEQGHPDYYPRMIDRKKDDIVVRGSEAHTRNGKWTN